MAVLDRIGLTPDVVIVEKEVGYPIATGSHPMRTEDNFEIEDLSEQGWSPLLRIERGRVRGRDVFGNLSLSHARREIDGLLAAIGVPEVDAARKIL